MRKVFMLITDIGFITYWAITALVALKVLNIPGEWLFNDYYDPRMVAWNWSFFPLDIILSVAGLYALYLERKGNEAWRVWAIFSLSLTHCAGLMAICFWVIIGDFDLSWWIPNLFLMIWPLFFLFSLSKAK